MVPKGTAKTDLLKVEKAVLESVDSCDCDHMTVAELAACPICYTTADFQAGLDVKLLELIAKDNDDAELDPDTYCPTAGSCDQVVNRVKVIIVSNNKAGFSSGFNVQFADGEFAVREAFDSMSKSDHGRIIRMLGQFFDASEDHCGPSCDKANEAVIILDLAKQKMQDRNDASGEAAYCQEGQTLLSARFAGDTDALATMQELCSACLQCSAGVVAMTLNPDPYGHEERVARVHQEAFANGYDSFKEGDGR